MTVSLRLICLTGLLMGALAIPATADQGRRDHDTPGTERQADPISPQQYSSVATAMDSGGGCRATGSIEGTRPPIASAI